MSSRIDDGHPTTIDIGSLPSGETLLFWEKTVTPPGIDGGGPNETTTMRNVTWRTMAPKQLVSLTEGAFTAAYDPECLDQLLDMINVNCLITVTFPNGDKWKFWGWLNNFTPNEVTEGEQPTATCSIHPSNQNDSGAETAPVYQAAA